MAKRELKEARLVASFIFFAFAGICFASPPIVDLSPNQEEQAQEIFHSTMSPYCPGRLLSDCPSTKANELKRIVRAKVSEGMSVDAIRADLNERYGEDALRASPDDGFGLLAWILPGVFFLVGFFGLVRWLRGMESPAQTEVAGDGSKPSDIEQRVRKDLEDL